MSDRFTPQQFEAARACEFALVNVRVHEDMSDETLAFTADIVRSGESVCRVRNDGRGGCNFYAWVPQDGLAAAFLATAHKVLPECDFEVEDELVDLLMLIWAGA